MCGEKWWCVTPLWQFISSHQSTFPGENREGSFDFLTRVSFGGGKGEFSHQSIFPGGRGNIKIVNFLFTGPGRGLASCLVIVD